MRSDFRLHPRTRAKGVMPVRRSFQLLILRIFASKINSKIAHDRRKDRILNLLEKLPYPYHSMHLSGFLFSQMTNPFSGMHSQNRSPIEYRFPDTTMTITWGEPASSCSVCTRDFRGEPPMRCARTVFLRRRDRSRSLRPYGSQDRDRTHQVSDSGEAEILDVALGLCR